MECYTITSVVHVLLQVPLASMVVELMLRQKRPHGGFGHIRVHRQFFRRHSDACGFGRRNIFPNRIIGVFGHIRVRRDCLERQSGDCGFCRGNIFHKRRFVVVVFKHDKVTRQTYL